MSDDFSGQKNRFEQYFRRRLRVDAVIVVFVVNHRLHFTLHHPDANSPVDDHAADVLINILEMLLVVVGDDYAVHQQMTRRVRMKMLQPLLRLLLLLLLLRVKMLLLFASFDGRGRPVGMVRVMRRR